MSTPEPTLDRSAVRRALRRADVLDAGDSATTDSAIEFVVAGVNESFVVDTRADDRLLVKFGTFSTPGAFRAGAGAYRLLGAYTDLPVPTVRAFDPDPDPDDLPSLLVREYLPGAPLPDSDGDAPDDATLAAVRLLGAVIREFGSLPPSASDGYGAIDGWESTDAGPRAATDFDDCAEMLVEYAAGLYADPPDHDAIRAVASTVPDYLDAQRERLPANPDPAVVVTDLAPGNLLAPGGDPPDALADLTGVIDLERARIGPREFTAVNAEYLLTRGVPDPEPYRTALYDPLPFGPDLPNRDLYRLIAMGRSVNALDLWYDPGGEAYRRRGEELAAEIRRIVE